MDSSIISGLIGGAVSVALCAYLSAKARSAPNDGRLKYGSWLVALGWCCLAWVGLAVWALFNDLDVWEKESELIAVIGLFIGFGLGAIYCFVEYFKTRGTYDDEGIDFYTPWTGRKVEKWCDLHSVEYKARWYGYVLRFKGGNTIRISSLLGGHGGVLSLLDEMGYDL